MILRVCMPLNVITTPSTGLPLASTMRPEMLPFVAVGVFPRPVYQNPLRNEKGDWRDTSAAPGSADVPSSERFPLPVLDVQPPLPSGPQPPPATTCEVIVKLPPLDWPKAVAASEMIKMSAQCFRFMGPP